MNGHGPAVSLDKARRYALRLLCVRARTRNELLTRIGERFPEEGIAECVLEELASGGLIDDMAFSVDWIRQRMQKKPRGKAFLRWKLGEKGVDETTIDRAFEYCAGFLDEEKVVRDLVRREFYGKTPVQNERNRVMRRLLAWGFEPEIVYRVFNDDNEVNGSNDI